jgi:NAD(P)-dependent dehydrogenase (short-subunit alcohol dehydrogenase family)
MGNKVKEILSQILKVLAAAVTDDLAMKDVEAWDSLKHMEMIVAFEEAYHSEFNFDEIAEKMVTSRRKAVIVNISSISAAGNAGQSVYSAAKAGVNALTMTWAKELNSFGIRVAAIAPGFSETESTREAVSASILADVVAKVPLRRLGPPEEIAGSVVL